MYMVFGGGVMVRCYGCMLGLPRNLIDRREAALVDKIRKVAVLQ